MPKTKIISAFPCTGKSHFFRSAPDGVVVWDSDSSQFSWSSPGVRHPDFPGNYIDHIMSGVGVADVILVSSHKVVRDALVEYRIPFTLVYPAKALKEEYLDRARLRGSAPEFVAMLEINWDMFFDEMFTQVGCVHRMLGAGEYIDAVIKLDVAA